MLARLARGEHDPDRLGQQAPGHERERERRRLVEPLSVIDDAQQRPLLSGLGQEAERGQPDQEPVGPAPSLNPKTTRSASRCGGGSRSRRSSSGAHS